MEKEKYTYDCNDNEVVIQVVTEGLAIDEICVKAKGDKNWLVIGYRDLLAAIGNAQMELDRRFE
jgi:hypothetical protein